MMGTPYVGVQGMRAASVIFLRIHLLCGVQPCRHGAVRARASARPCGDDLTLRVVVVVLRAQVEAAGARADFPRVSAAAARWVLHGAL